MDDKCIALTPRLSTQYCSTKPKYIVNNVWYCTVLHKHFKKFHVLLSTLRAGGLLNENIPPWSKKKKKKYIHNSYS